MALSFLCAEHAQQLGGASPLHNLMVKRVRIPKPGGGGVNMVQASVWNVGTYDSDGKREIQVEDPQG
jgi:hypothetical protein